jgi:hypothetical protein
MVVPMLEKDIPAINEAFSERVHYEPLDAATTPENLFKEMMASYFSFYEDKTTLKPRINATEGQAMKAIIKHLTTLSPSPEEVLAMWQQLLSNWSTLPIFYLSQMELRQINSNINILLNHLKNGTTETKPKHHADDLRQKV